MPGGEGKLIKTSVSPSLFSVSHRQNHAHYSIGAFHFSEVNNQPKGCSGVPAPEDGRTPGGKKPSHRALQAPIDLLSRDFSTHRFNRHVRDGYGQEQRGSRICSGAG